MRSSSTNAPFVVWLLLTSMHKAAWLSPLARLACRLGASDITAHPWTALEQDASALNARSFRGGTFRSEAAGSDPDPRIAGVVIGV